jgi:hypothetical protein
MTETLGVPHHACLIAVEDVRREDGKVERATIRDAHGRPRDVQQFNDDRPATVRVLGREEDYLLAIFSFEQ